MPDHTPTSPATEPEHVSSWRTIVASLCTWASFIGIFGGGIIFTTITESGVESDRHDPGLWKAMFVCSCLAASGLLTVIDPMRSRRQTGVGVVGFLGVLFILIFWGPSPAPRPLMGNPRSLAAVPCRMGASTGRVDGRGETPPAASYLHATGTGSDGSQIRLTIRGHFVLDKRTGQVRRNTNIITCRVS